MSAEDFGVVVEDLALIEEEVREAALMALQVLFCCRYNATHVESR